MIERDGEDFIQFDVEDTGIGIPVGKQQKIFDSFSQADNSTTRKYGGTGLGLAITKSLSGLLGGELSLSSEDGRGSVFTLTIKADVIADDDIEAESEEADAKGSNSAGVELQKAASGSDGESGDGVNKGKLLVAEDVATNQKLIKLMLEKMGFEVDIAENGRVAVDKVLACSYDIIFMDIQMPEMNGYEATGKIRENNIDTPIIALTANAMKGDAEKCIEAGCDDYMPKPIDRKKISEILEYYLSRSARKFRGGKGSAGGKSDIEDDSGYAETNDNGEVVFDYQQFLDRSGGAGEIMDAIVDTWQTESPGKLKKIFEAFERGEMKDLAFEAHAFKSMSANIGGVGLSSKVQELELAAKKCDFKRCKELLRVIEKDYQVLEGKLADKFDFNKA
jgi:CheY-like chemotaxis protein